MITVWGRKSSSNVQAVMWTIAELGLLHERIDAGFTYGVVDTDDYLAINPNGTVPTIQDGDQTPLFESGAIIRYLASEYGDETFWPSSASERAQIDQWTEWSKINVALKFTAPVFWQVVRIPKQRHNPELIRKGLTAFEKNLKIANECLEHQEFLTGEHFTPADIQFGHVLFRYFDLPIERAELPALQAYYERLCERRSYQQHVMQSYEELRDSM